MYTYLKQFLVKLKNKIVSTMHIMIELQDCLLIDIISFTILSLIY